MDENRKMWNDRQQELRQALMRPGDQRRGLDLFLVQHAMVHSAGLSPEAHGSFADEALRGASEAGMRRIPPNGEHSVAWVLWHIARIEDMTMNLLVAGENQVFKQGGWAQRMGAEVTDTANAMDAQAVAGFSAQVDLAALLAYRQDVGRATQAQIRGLDPARLKEKVSADRLARIRAEGGVVDAANWLLEYWGGLTIAGLLLMPPTRHNFVHLNEIVRLRQKRR